MSTTRKVTIVSTKNNKVKFYETAATTWGELNAEINKDFDLSNLKATENVNKTTLEHVDAVLPEGEFRVFLRPVKTKSGGHDFDNMKFGDLRATFKTDEEVKKFLTGKVSAEGRNWTQLKTDELRTFLKEYHAKAVSSVVESVKDSKTEAVTDDVKEEVADIQEVPWEGVELNTTEKFQTAMQLLREVVQDVNDSDIDEDRKEEIECIITDDFVDAFEDDILDDLRKEFGGNSSTKQASKAKSVAKAVPSKPVETEEQRIAREAAEAEEAEIADALREGKEFGSGFTN